MVKMMSDKKLNKVQVEAVVNGAVAVGFKIYGDEFIGYRAFNDYGEEFDFAFALEYQDGEEAFDNVEEFRRTCSVLVFAGYSDCKWW